MSYQECVEKYYIRISEYISALEITIHSHLLFILKCHLWKYALKKFSVVK